MAPPAFYALQSLPLQGRWHGGAVTEGCAGRGFRIRPTLRRIRSNLPRTPQSNCLLRRQFASSPGRGAFWAHPPGTRKRWGIGAQRPVREAGPYEGSCVGGGLRTPRLGAHDRPGIDTQREGRKPLPYEKSPCFRWETGGSLNTFYFSRITAPVWASTLALM